MKKLIRKFLNWLKDIPPEPDCYNGGKVHHWNPWGKPIHGTVTHFNPVIGLGPVTLRALYQQRYCMFCEKCETREL